MTYSLASVTWDEDELTAIDEVIKSGMFSMGRYVAQFESAFARHFGAKFAVMVNSGSSANLLAIAALATRSVRPLKPGDEVIVPAVSWPTTYAPLQQYGLRLVFVDIDKETLNFDLEQLECAITEKTRLVFAVNLLGNPNQYDILSKALSSRGIDLIEDNCESMGATYQGQQCGTFGLIGTFSTFFSHHISTMEGGVLVTDNEEIYHLALSMRAHGWTRNLPSTNKLVDVSSDPFFESFRFIVPGYNLRPLEMSGAIGLKQLQKLPSLLSDRRRNAMYFKDLFMNHEHFMIQRGVGDPSWFGFSLVLRDTSDLDRAIVVEKLFEAGIECRPIVAGNFTRHDAINYFDYRVYGDLTNANRVHDRGLFVGNNHGDLRENIDYLSKVLTF